MIGVELVWFIIDQSVKGFIFILAFLIIVKLINASKYFKQRSFWKSFILITGVYILFPFLIWRIGFLEFIKPEYNIKAIYLFMIVVIYLFEGFLAWKIIEAFKLGVAKIIVYEYAEELAAKQSEWLDIIQVEKSENSKFFDDFHYVQMSYMNLDVILKTYRIFEKCCDYNYKYYFYAPENNIMDIVDDYNLSELVGEIYILKIRRFDKLKLKTQNINEINIRKTIKNLNKNPDVKIDYDYCSIKRIHEYEKGEA